MTVIDFINIFQTSLYTYYKLIKHKIMQIGFLSFYVIHYLYEYSISYKSYKTFQSNKHQRLPDQPNYIISNSLQYFLSTHKVHTPVHIFLCQKNHDKDHQPIQPTSHLPPILNSLQLRISVESGLHTPAPSDRSNQVKMPRRRREYSTSKIAAAECGTSVIASREKRERHRNPISSERNKLAARLF